MSWVTTISWLFSAFLDGTSLDVPDLPGDVYVGSLGVCTHLLLPPAENAFSGWLLVTFASASAEVHHTLTLFLGSPLILHGPRA